MTIIKYIDININGKNDDINTEILIKPISKHSLSTALII